MTPWIMVSSVRWLSWILPSALVSEGVSVFMATGGHGQSGTEARRMRLLKQHAGSQRIARTAWLGTRSD